MALECQSKLLAALQESDAEHSQVLGEARRQLEMRKLDLTYLQSELRDARSRCDGRERDYENCHAKALALESKVRTNLSLPLDGFVRITVVAVRWRNSQTSFWPSSSPRGPSSRRGWRGRYLASGAYLGRTKQYVFLALTVTVAGV